MGKVIFATVGTTKFDLLISTLTQIDVLKALKNHGYNHLIIQIGNGTILPNKKNADQVAMNITFYKFKTSLQEDITKADLVISHGGAGTCLEVLEAEKPLLVVINEQLMHNHQTELANQLSSEGYLYSCTCSNLLETINLMDINKLKKMEPANPKIFANYLDKYMGFQS